MSETDTKMACEEPDIVLKALAVLTQPVAKGTLETSAEGHAISFEGILKDCIKNLFDLFQNDKSFEVIATRVRDSTASESGLEGGICWKYVQMCLKLLTLFNESLHSAMKRFTDVLESQTQDGSKSTESSKSHSKAPPISPDTLSVAQQKVVMSVIQFIVCLGICPYLPPGVGVPVQLRSGYGQHVKASTTMDAVGKNCRISVCLDVLLDCIQQPSLGSVILSRHLSDVLAALLQMCYGPRNRAPKSVTTSVNEKTDLEEKEATSAISGAAVRQLELDTRLQKLDLTSASPGMVISALQKPPSSQDSNNSDHDASPVIVCSNCGKEHTTECWTKYEKQLKDLLDHIYPPMLVRELVMLQGGPRQMPPKVSKNSKSSSFPPAPLWLRKICGQLLSEFLMKPQGVQYVLRGLLEGTTGADGSKTSDGTGTSGDWRKCNAVAKIISSCPKQAGSVEAYYKVVCPQVLDLLHIKDRFVARQFLRVACSTISTMFSQYPDLTKKYVLNPLLQPLVECLGNHEVIACNPPKIWLSEKTLSGCIEDIHKVFIIGTEPQAPLLQCLAPVMSPVFKLFCFCKRGVSHLRSACLEILKTFLKNTDKSVAFQILKCLAYDSYLSDTEGMDVYHVMHPDLKFVPGEDGGVLVIAEKRTEDQIGGEQDLHVSCLVEILKDLQKDGLAGEFFLFILEELTQILSQIHDNDDRPKEKTGNPSEALLHLEADVQESHKKKLVTMMLLIKMCEVMDHSCLTSAEHVIKFAKATLLRSVYVLDNTEDVATGVFETETITLAIGLLTATMSGAVKIHPEDRERMKELLPLLDDLASKHPEQEVQEMANDIRIAIATYGAVWTDSLASAAKKAGQKGREKKDVHVIQKKPTRILIEEVDSSQNDESEKSDIVHKTGIKNIHGDGGAEKMDTTPQNHAANPEEKASNSSRTGVKVDSKEMRKGKSDSGVKKSPLGQALNELCDPLIPVRGHALISLAKLIGQRDNETLEKHELLLKIFKENIQHDDSYIYLAAINGLAGLCDGDATEIVPMLAEEFVTVVDKKKGSRTAELRMKLGEVLMKVSRSLGEMVPKYRDVLVNAFLSGVKDEDHLIRASSLSNLGEVCKLLRFSLGNILQEVFLCTSSLLRSDPAIEVKRAAAMVITLMLRGVGQDALLILVPILRDLYRLLKQSIAAEKDDQVQLHTQLALEELDKIMKEYLFPKQSLAKTIYVADKPPS